MFIGPRQEAFFIDLGATFDKVTIRDLDTRGNVGNKGGGVNSLAGYNIDVIAIQIPIAKLGVANPAEPAPRSESGPPRAARRSP